MEALNYDYFNPAPAPAFTNTHESRRKTAFSKCLDEASRSKIDYNGFYRLTPTQQYCLLRLERSLRMRHCWEKTMGNNLEAVKTDLTGPTIFSALKDCRSEGVGDEAVKLITDWES